MSKVKWFGVVLSSSVVCTVLPNSVVSRLKQNVLTSHMFRRAMPFSSDQAKQANKQQPVLPLKVKSFRSSRALSQNNRTMFCPPVLVGHA